MMSTMFSFLAVLQITDDSIRVTKTMDLDSLSRFQKIIRLEG